MININKNLNFLGEKQCFQWGESDSEQEKESCAWAFLFYFFSVALSDSVLTKKATHIKLRRGKKSFFEWFTVSVIVVVTIRLKWQSFAHWNWIDALQNTHPTTAKEAEKHGQNMYEQTHTHTSRSLSHLALCLYLKFKWRNKSFR